MNEQITEYYSDVFYLRTSPWGVAVTFAEASPKDGIPERDTCIVRLSHETAKAMTMMLRKQLKTYEKEMQSIITIPPTVMKELNLTLGDW